jgi:IS605 OrfB family transposase
LYKNFGTAISYRFKKDEKGIEVFVTFSLKEPEFISKKDYGLIGVDINSNHLAVVETDRFLNPIKTLKIPLNLYGKNKSLAIIGEASKEIVNLAIKTQKPIILEKLDFQKKKIALKDLSNKFSRLLSSFSYTSIKKTIKSKAFRSKIEVFEVNPSYTTVIGKVKFAKRYGLHNHFSAALTIARRFMNASEKPPRNKNIKVFDAKGSMRAFLLPDMDRKKHLWSFWGKVLGLFKAMDAPYFQSRKSRSSSIHISTRVTKAENLERNSQARMFVDRTARSTSL